MVAAAVAAAVAPAALAAATIVIHDCFAALTSQKDSISSVTVSAKYKLLPTTYTGSEELADHDGIRDVISKLYP